MTCISLFINDICERKTDCLKCDKPIFSGEKRTKGLAKLSNHFYSFHKKCYVMVLKENLKEINK